MPREANSARAVCRGGHGGGFAGLANSAGTTTKMPDIKKKEDKTTDKIVVAVRWAAMGAFPIRYPRVVPNRLVGNFQSPECTFVLFAHTVAALCALCCPTEREG